MGVGLWSVYGCFVLVVCLHDMVCGWLFDECDVRHVFACVCVCGMCVRLCGYCIVCMLMMCGVVRAVVECCVVNDVMNDVVWMCVVVVWIVCRRVYGVVGRP